jgi:hypothetical protein
MGALTALAALAAAAGPPVQAHVTVTPATAGVGVPVTAEARITIDPQRVDPATVRVSFGVAPLAALGRVEQTGLRFRVVAACLDEACAPDAQPRPVHLVPIRVTGRLRNGRPLSASFSWPVLVLVPRVPAAALRGNPPFRLEASAPPTRYRVAPGTLAAVLDAAAAVLALAVAAVVFLLRRRAVRRRAELSRDPLDRALALARESAHRPAEDRRRALGLLARVLDRRRPALAEPIEALAWSRPPPSAEATTSLADDVEQAVHRQ